MLDELLNDIGKFLVYKIKQEIKTPRPRFTNPRAKINPRRMKRGSPYNFYATGKLWNSVEYRVDNGEIYILMEDYGVDYVFGSGSYPGGGAYYPDTRTARASTSALIDSLTKWAIAKFNMPIAQAKGMAFAVRKNLFKSGYAGYNLFQEEFETNIFNYVETLLEQPQYQDALLREQLGNIFDRINLLGTETYEISLG